MATLKDAINKAKLEPTSERALRLKDAILSGKMDAQAQSEGIDLEAFKNKFGKKTVETPGFLKKAAGIATTSQDEMTQIKGENAKIGLTANIETENAKPKFEPRKLVSSEGIDPLAPAENILSETPALLKEGATKLVSGLAGQAKAAAPAILPALSIVPGFRPQDRKNDNGESLLKTTQGATEILSSVFMPIIQSLPGGEKASEVLNPSTWAKKAFKLAAQEAGVDTSSPDYQLAEEQIGSATDVAGLTFGPKIMKDTSDWLKTKLNTITDTNAVANVEKVVKNRMSELDKLENSNSKVRRAIEDANSKGVNVKQIISESDLLKDSVDPEGTIRTSQEGGAIDQLNEFIRPQEDVISKVLEKEGKKIPLAELEAKLKTAIRAKKITGAAKIKALKAITEEIDGLKLDADTNNSLTLSQLQDAKVNKYATINYSDPTAKIVDKTIAKTFKEIIEENTDSVDVAGLNKELASHYQTLNFLEKLDGTKVHGGRMGKYFGQTVGAIVGSHFGPLGALLGAEAGSLIKGKLMEGTFKGTTGKALESSPAMKSAMESVVK